MKSLNNCVIRRRKGEEQIDEQSVINSKLLDAIKNIYRSKKMNDMTYYSDDSNRFEKEGHVSEYHRQKCFLLTLKDLAWFS